MTPTPTAAEALAVVIASELAKIDGCDFEELHALRWSGGSAPEPLGDAWSMDYLPKGERIARAIAAPPAAEGVMAALDRMDALLDPACGLLSVPYNSATVKASRDDMRTIRAAITTPADEAAQVEAPPEAVSDAAVEAALSASGDYWTEPEHATTCHVCRGSGTVACGEYSQDGCDNCGGGGVVHSGTEEGAMRSALAAACQVVHRGALVMCSSRMRHAYSDEHVRAETAIAERDALKAERQWRPISEAEAALSASGDYWTEPEHATTELSGLARSKGWV